MSILKFDWEAVTEQPIAYIVGRGERQMSDGSLAWDALAFVLGDSAVVLTVNTDTDEIVVAHESTPRSESWIAVAALSDAVGKPLGWCWVGTNYRGSRDSFTLAFGDEVPDALQPRLTFLGEGSSLSCFEMTPRS